MEHRRSMTKTMCNMYSLSEYREPLALLSYVWSKALRVRPPRYGVVILSKLLRKFRARLPLRRVVLSQTDVVSFDPWHHHVFDRRSTCLIQVIEDPTALRFSRRSA